MSENKPGTEALTPRQEASGTLREILELIDGGSLEATEAERAFIAGSVTGIELAGS